jgi:glycosyltransferase involved in cell wall biosynthesis
MFEGLAQAIERGVELQLVIVGRVGKHRDERDAVAALERLPELKKRTVLTGWVTDEQLAEHLRTAGAFVLLRDQDRETQALFPTRLPEYLLSANPVILSDAGDLPLYVRHRESAWVIPAGHAPSELADAVVALASDEPLRQRIGLAGWHEAVGKLSLEVLGRKLHDFLASVVSKPDRSRG